MNITSADELLNYLKKSNNYHIYIWGTSVFGNAIGKVLNANGVRWDGYYDNFITDPGSLLNGKFIRTGGELDISQRAKYILSMRNYSGVKKQLLDSSVLENDIIWFENYLVLEEMQNAAYKGMKYYEKCAKFGNIYKNERCFVIGNGPSLILEDLEKLKDEKTFACNLIFQCFDKTIWRPTNYFYIDTNGIRTSFPSKESALKVFTECENVFVRGASEMWEYRDDPDFYNMYLLNMKFSESVENFDFSEDCSKKVVMGYTVTYAMLQMAIYMGFKKIYLLGLDHNFSKVILKNGSVIEGRLAKKDEHSSILGNYNLPNGTEIDKLERAYMRARTYAEEHGVKIYNATRGGYLEIFERVDFDKLF